MAIIGLWCGIIRAEVGAQTLEGARWIWFAEGNPAADAPTEKRFFRKTFEIPADQTIRRALMLATADNAYVAWVNGKKVAASEHLRAVPAIDVTGSLHPGTN